MTETVTREAGASDTLVGGLLETCLYAADLEAAEAFYGGVLGLSRVARVAGRHVFFRAGPSMFFVFNPAATREPTPGATLPVPTHGATGPGHVCFRCTALDAMRARLEACGHPAEADFRWPNGARSLYVRDPAGNSVEFAEPALWGC
ncbi:glyoxalase/bleomycin resistance/extradiol dioxygenase family protein [Paroceanicella profunda]|uniref:Glyoxalase/bleomycin resistance/extradiol dioxygenase family protein n=1 Tax=Paroceanicella profunda TaxID=2579971 RepID=A0A5B8G1D9_9RHOB|nr:VOC family protein [Paroceanicella profunda]QDL93670.1 glyoxalase/bleomycin resistance/extradiol dioxygenase family protein [Paroceanicella profunda]